MATMTKGPRVHAPLPWSTLQAARGTKDAKMGTTQHLDVAVDARLREAPLG